MYEIIRAGERLYVGFSSRGFTRAFNQDKTRNAEGERFKAYEQADIVRVTVFDNVAEARAEEKRLILLYKPKFNQQGVPGRVATYNHIKS